MEVIAGTGSDSCLNGGGGVRVVEGEGLGDPCHPVRATVLGDGGSGVELGGVQLLKVLLTELTPRQVVGWEGTHGRCPE